MEATRSFVVSLLRVALATAYNNNDVGDDEKPDIQAERGFIWTILGDDESELYTTSQDLDSFMKSFEEEIRGSPSSKVDLKSGSKESQLDLGYLLEALDDETGLPSSKASRAGVLSEMNRLGGG
ncbi:Hypothetical predicted protein [Olea europaea subsp. europaea]|uniref:Uncharacterized protein n=1 Tax=Olea europaea subsp. europaea TaxID=158383 RepID=A0A8S0P8V9_OLEEU|nr:Hypothetical predicted protein [Olea europaea subsp. europaea]